MADPQVDASADLDPDERLIELTSRAEALRSTFSQAHEAALRTVAALSEGRRPDTPDLDRVTAAVAGFDSVASALEQATGAQDTDTRTLDALDTGVLHAMAVRADVHLCDRFRTLDGPPALKGVLSLIRAAAAQRENLDCLKLLANLSDEIKTDPYGDTATRLLTRTADLPPEWQPAVMAVARGQLALPPAGGPVVPAPSSPAVAPAAEQGGHPAERAQAEETAEQTTGEGSAGVGAGARPPESEHPLEEFSLDALDARLADESCASTRTAPVLRPAAVQRKKDPAEPSPQAPKPRQVPEPQRPPAAQQVQKPRQVHVPRPEALRSATGDPRVRHLSRQAVEDRRLALSGWLHRAAGDPESVTRGRFAAALAHDVIETGGDLAERFHDQAVFLADHLPEARDERLLVWAAALRAGLVSPSPEVHQLMQNASSAVSGQTALSALHHAFDDAAQRGIRLNAAESREHLRDTQLLRESREEAVAKAREDSEHAPRRKVNYQGATQVWQVLVSPGGALRPLIDIPAGDDAQRVEELRAINAGIDPGQLVDEIHRRTSKRSRSHRKRIEARARNSLMRYIDDVRSNARAWENAVHHLGELERVVEGSLWGLDGLNRLSTASGKHLGPAMEELDALDHLGGESSPALTAAGQLLRSAGRLLAGDGHVSSHLTGELLLVRDLLLVPECRIDADAHCERPASVDEIEGVISAPADWRTAFTRRVERGDLVGAELLTRAVRADDPALADELAGRIDARVTEERRTLAEAASAFKRMVARNRLYGALSEDQANRLHNEANGLTEADRRRDFDVLHDQLRTLEDEAERIRQARIRGQRAEVEEQAAANTAVARYADRLRRYLENGRVTTCDELLSRLKKGESVPEENAEHDHFNSFFPSFPQVMEGSRQQRGKHGHAVLHELRDLFKGEGTLDLRHLPTPQHRELLQPVLTGQRDGSDPGRATANKGLRQWCVLSEGHRAKTNNRHSALGEILNLLGVTGSLQPDQASATAERRGSYHFVCADLTGATPNGEAVLPDFGSRMSTDGSRLRLQLVWGQPSPLEFTEWSRSDTSEDQTVLVLYFGLLSVKQRMDLAELARTRSGPVTAVVDDAVIAYLAALALPEWSTTVHLTAPFTVSKPFQSERMIPEEMFYGRREAREAVMARSGAHFVYGGRQLGKSVLLDEAARRLSRDRNAHVVMRDIKSVSQATEMWGVLGSALEEKGICRQGELTAGTKETVCSAIRSWSNENPDQRLLVLLDESDAFLTNDADDHDFSNVVAMRELMNTTDSRFKVVFAGLHNTSRFRSLPNQPFANLGEAVSIGPLSSPDAFDLLVRPLQALGYVLPEELAVSIIAQANNAPALVQYFGQELLRRLRSTRLPSLPYEVNADDVDAVQTDPVMSEAFRQRFDWTLDLDLRYKVIAYVVALHTIDERGSVIHEKDLLEECPTWWPDGFENCARDEFSSLVEECVDLGVLARGEGEGEEGYRLRTPHILTLLGGYKRVERELETAQERYEKRNVLDAASYRRTHCGGPELSPLTSGQVSLLSRTDHRLRIVVGSKATQLEQVPRALQNVKGELGASVWEVSGDGLTLAGAFQRCGTGKNLILVRLAPSDSPAAALRMLEEADRLLRASSERVSVIVVAHPPLAEVISGAMGYPAGEEVDPVLERAEVVELRRFGGSGLRQWRLLDHFSRLVDETVQTRLLEVTGGWPHLVNRVIRQVAEQDREPSLVLDEMAAWLAEPDNAAAFLADTGIGNHPVLAQAWSRIRGFLPEEPDQLADLLEADWDDVSPELDAFVARGPLASLGLVEVLRGLGALVPEITSSERGQRLRLRSEEVLDRLSNLVLSTSGEDV